MSETQKPDPAAINKLSATPTEEHIQFADGRVALGFRTPGDQIHWSDHKYTRHLGVKDSPDLAIVSTEGGRRFAIGSGVAVMLPPSLNTEGRFKSDTKELAAVSITSELPDLTLGEPWELIGGEERISDVVVDYKDIPTGHEGVHRVEYANPFDHAREIVRDVAERMDATGQL